MGRAIIRVSPDFICAFASRGGAKFKITAVEGGLPADAKYTTCHYDPNRGCFLVLMESPSFRDVPEGEMIPVLENRVMRFDEIHEPIILRLWNWVCPKVLQGYRLSIELQRITPNPYDQHPDIQPDQPNQPDQT